MRTDLHSAQLVRRDHLGSPADSDSQVIASASHISICPITSINVFHLGSTNWLPAAVPLDGTSKGRVRFVPEENIW